MYRPRRIAVGVLLNENWSNSGCLAIIVIIIVALFLFWGQVGALVDLHKLSEIEQIIQLNKNCVPTDLTVFDYKHGWFPHWRRSGVTKLRKLPRSKKFQSCARSFNRGNYRVAQKTSRRNFKNRLITLLHNGCECSGRFFCTTPYKAWRRLGVVASLLDSSLGASQDSQLPSPPRSPATAAS